MEKEIDHWKDVAKQESIQREIAEFNHEIFRQEVASALPNIIYKKKEEDYPKRRLASVTQAQTNFKLEHLKIKLLAKEIKKTYRNKKYKKTIYLGKAFIQKYSYSSYVPEIYYLLAESYFNLKKFDKSVIEVNNLIDLFPESEVTAYGLIVLAKIYVNNQRIIDAAEIYRTVLKSFNTYDVKAQAKLALEKLRL